MKKRRNGKVAAISRRARVWEGAGGNSDVAGRNRLRKKGAWNILEGTGRVWFGAVANHGPQRGINMALKSNDDDMMEDIDDEDEDTISNMYLTFQLGNEDYGVEIAYVTEIVGMQNITEVPDMPAFVKGVVNLRGQVIPVIDMRLRFHMPARDYDERTCIVVVNIRNVQLGLVVDTVNEVRTIDPAHISPPPRVASSHASRYIKGMGKVGDEVKILLDANKVMFDEEIESLGSK